MTYKTDCLGESNGNEIATYIGVTVSGIDRSGARGPRATKVNIDVGRVKQSTPQPFKERGPGMSGHQKENENSYRPSRSERLDPRYLEIQEARRRMVLCAIKSSCADRSHTYFWVLMIWGASALALSPFQRFTFASVFAAFIALAWATVHNVRRI